MGHEAWGMGHGAWAKQGIGNRGLAFMTSIGPLPSSFWLMTND
jgi:hypothetical protein